MQMLNEIILLFGEGVLCSKNERMFRERWAEPKLKSDSAVSIMLNM